MFFDYEYEVAINMWKETKARRIKETVLSIEFWSIYVVLFFHVTDVIK